MKISPMPATHGPSLQRYISQSGYCSRRKAAQLIAEGKATLDSTICTEPWQAVLPHQRVQIEGTGITRPRRRLYLALHKPPGYLSTNVDPQGRECAIHLIQPIYKERLFHVGRLDKNSSGLIFFTNDGDFAQIVQHPSHSIEKEYTIKTRKSIPEFVLQHWQRGLEIEGIRYQLQRYELLGQREVRLVLAEGLNREIRRVFEHFHIPLKRVHRLRIGSVRLRGLRPGEFRPLQAHEIRAFQETTTENRPKTQKNHRRGQSSKCRNPKQRDKMVENSTYTPADKPIYKYKKPQKLSGQMGLYNHPGRPWQTTSQQNQHENRPPNTHRSKKKWSGKKVERPKTRSRVKPNFWGNPNPVKNIKGNPKQSLKLSPKSNRHIKPPARHLSSRHLSRKSQSRTKSVTNTKVSRRKGVFYETENHHRRRPQLTGDKAASKAASRKSGL